MKTFIKTLFLLALFTAFALLIYSNINYDQQVSYYEQQVDELNDKVDYYEELNGDLSSVIDRIQSDYNSQISYYTELYYETFLNLTEAQSQLTDVTIQLNEALGQNEVDAETIAQLTNDLQEAQDELFTTRENLTYISNQLELVLLENADYIETIDLLNTTIDLLNTTIETLQNQIIELNNTVKYYKELLEAYQDSDKLIVTFILVNNGIETVYDVQTINENDYLSEVVTPEGYFEGWTYEIGGEYINSLTSVQVTENLTIYGIFSHTVTYIINNEELTEVVVYNGKITKTASLEGFDFTGWSLSENGTILSSDYSVTQDITVYAVFEKNITVVTNYTLFSGVSGSFGSSCIWTDGVNIYYSDVRVNGGTYTTNKQYILDIESRTWSEMTWYGLPSDYFTFDGGYIWTDGTNIYYSLNSYQYVLDIATSTWSEMTWTGLTRFYGSAVWTDGVNIYYSYYTDQYILDIATSTWSEMTWTGLTSFSGTYIWTDGTNIYLTSNSESYILNIETHTWSEITWNGLTPEYGTYIWTDGTNIYYSLNSYQYVLIPNTQTWLAINIDGNNDIYGPAVWTDGTNIYQYHYTIIYT